MKMKKTRQIMVLGAVLILTSLISNNFDGKQGINENSLINDKPMLSRPLQNYTMTLNTSFDWINITDANNLNLGHNYHGNHFLPWSFPFYDVNYSQYYMASESGMISFENSFSSSGFPDSNAKLAIAIFSNDLNPSSPAGIYEKTLTGPDRYVLIFENITYWSGGALAGSFEIILYRSGLIRLQYKNIQNIQGSPFCGINRGLGDNYFNFYNNLNTSMINYSIDFTYSPNLNAPTLTDGKVSPTTGDQSDLYTFSVNYTDLDNHVPKNINITINGTTNLMQKQDSQDKDYADGCIYEFSTYLQPGTSNYSFGCYDGDYYNESISYLTPKINFTNTLPPSLSGGVVHPITGYDNMSTFTFLVTYKDDDNNAPNYVNLTLDGKDHAMTRVDIDDQNYMDGNIYNCSMMIEGAGYHQYYYSCNDENYTTSSGPHYGPYIRSPTQSLENYSTFDLTGFRVGAVTYYGGRNSFDEYPVLKADLISRGATLSNITSEITEGLLANHDLLWFDNYGFISSTALLDMLYNWVQEGGTLFLTGGVISNQNQAIMQRFNMDYYWIPVAHSGTVSNLPRHPISQDVNGFRIGSASGYLDISTQPEAYPFLSYEGDVIGMVLESGNGSIATISDNTCFTDDIDEDDNRLLANNTFGWFHSLKNLIKTAPALTNGSVSPTIGNQSTLFTFSVNYTDVDNNGPTQVNVVINGTAHMMLKKNVTESNFTDGCIYEYSTYLNWNVYPHEYFFNCSDGLYTNATQSYSGPTVSYVNTVGPALNGGRALPKEGEAGITRFYFTVNYSDIDNNFPYDVNLTLDGVNYTMSQQDTLDTNYMDGCIFNYSIIINSTGVHEYNFTAFDGLAYAFDGSYTDISTNDTVGPIISNVIVSPITGPSGTVFKFNVSIWDFTGINTVIGHVKYQNETILSTITFFDDGNHGDGASGDGVYGTEWNSWANDTGLYLLDINATDTTAQNYKTEYKNLEFAIINWSCEIGEEYRWNITAYTMMPDIVGSHYIVHVSDINISKLQGSSIWGNLSLYNLTNGQTLLMIDTYELENYTFSTCLYDQPPSGGLLLPFLTLPIDMEKVNESIHDIMFQPGILVDSRIYHENLTLTLNFTVMSMNYFYIFQWNVTGIQNNTWYYLNGVLNAHYALLGPDLDAPLLTNPVVFPEIEVVGTPFNITTQVTDPSGVKNVTARIDYPDLVSHDIITMHDDGNHSDGAAGDGVYGLSWDSSGKNSGKYNVSINVTDNNGYSNNHVDILQFEVTVTDITAPILISSSVTPGLGHANMENEFNITAQVWDGTAVGSVIASIQHPDESEVTSLTLYDDGNHADGAAGDGIFGNTWNSGSREKGTYYIDITCVDSLINAREYENVLYISIVDWALAVGDVLKYNVTKNTLLTVPLMPQTLMPVGFQYKIKVTDINSTYVLGYGINAYSLWGNTYQDNNTGSWLSLRNSSRLVDINLSRGLYLDSLFSDIGGGSSFRFTTIVPAPMEVSIFQWIAGTGYYDTSFPQPMFTRVFTNTSIQFNYILNMYSLTIHYNNDGIMINYSFIYLGEEFFMELIYQGQDPDVPPPGGTVPTTTTTTATPGSEIPFGDVYLVFMAIGIITLVFYKRRKILVKS